MTLVRDYAWCHPKKRPLPFVYQQNSDFEANENEEPQDLSLKTRQRVRDLSPPSKMASVLEEKKILHESSKLPAHLMVNAPPSRTPSWPPTLAPSRPPTLTPSRPPTLTPSQTPTLTPQSTPLNKEQKSFTRENSFMSEKTFLSAKSFLSDNEGLRLISDVALKVGEMKELLPTARYPSEYSITPVQNRSSYAPPTPRSPVRLPLRERDPWSYHPYLPLSVYGLPSSSYSHSMNSLSGKDPLAGVRPRTGSTSPPGGETTTEASSSGSEGSPEQRGDRLSCPDCSRGYATVAGLSRHQQFHCLKDANRTFECQHCPKTYTSLGALKMHIRTHTLPCKCHVCGKAFSRPWLLQGHIRTHTGEKPFECHQCQRSFADRSNLRAHLQTHADVKKYACATCPKTFSRMSLLLKHQDHGCPGAIRPRPFSVAATISSSPLV